MVPNNDMINKRIDGEDDEQCKLNTFEEEEVQLVCLCELSEDEGGVLRALRIILENEWPRGGAREPLLKRLITECPFKKKNAVENTFEKKHFGGFCLCRTKSKGVKEVLGFARLEPNSATSSLDSFGGGVVGIITSVVVAESCRGKGLGKVLMRLLEKKAIESGCHFLYLWATAGLGKGFYCNSCGFNICKKEAALVPALDCLDESSVNRLESLLSRRMGDVMTKRVNSESSSCCTESCGLRIRQDSNNECPDESHIWLSKRIIYTDYPVQHISGKKWVELVNRAIQTHSNTAVAVRGDMSAHSYNITLRCIDLGWCKQIGPTCGIQAIRMICAAFRRLSNAACFAKRSLTYSFSISSECAEKEIIDLPPESSEESEDLFNVLKWAIDNGYSSQGELFDIDYVRVITERLAGECLGENAHRIDVRIEKLKDIGFSGIVDILTDEESCGFIVLPYDRDSKQQSKPCCHQGKSAHYAVLCGLAIPTSSSRLLSKHDTLIMGLQSMSLNPVIATYEEWEQSNEQLFRGVSPEEYLVHTRGWRVPTNGVNIAKKCVVVTFR